VAKHAKEPKSRQDDRLVAEELDRLREEVVRPRSRTDAGAVKEQILTLLAEAARTGVRKVAPKDLLASLTARFAYTPRPGANAEMIVRKALYDIARQARDWYEAKPDHPIFVLVTSSGKIEVFESALPAKYDASETASALHQALLELPNLIRARTAAPARNISTVPSSVALAQFAKRFPELAPKIPPEYASAYEDVLYACTCYGIEMAVRAVRPDAEIIAVEHHPTHRIGAWDEPLLWLDTAYRHHRLRNGSIIRLVVMDDEESFSLATDDEKWTNWKAHIQRRLFTDKVRILIDPTPTWRNTIARDLLILPDLFVIEFCGGEGFPFVMYARQGTDAARISSVAKEIAHLGETDRIASIDDPDDHSRFADIRKRLERAAAALLPRAAGK